MERSHRTANLYIRIPAANLLTNHQAPLLKGCRNDVFVANADILQIERLGMTCIGTHLGPLACCWISIGPLDEVT